MSRQEPERAKLFQSCGNECQTRKRHGSSTATQDNDCETSLPTAFSPAVVATKARHTLTRKHLPTKRLACCRSPSRSVTKRSRQSNQSTHENAVRTLLQQQRYKEAKHKASSKKEKKKGGESSTHQHFLWVANTKA